MSELINPFMHFQIIKDYRQESQGKIMNMPVFKGFVA